MCMLKRIDEKAIETINPLTRFAKKGKKEFNHEANLLTRHWGNVKAVLQGKVIPPFEIELQTSSRCNLTCNFCIGSATQKGEGVTRLPNNIDAANILTLASGITDYSVDTFRVERVKFSGFIGEPLVNKPATLLGMKHFLLHGREVGLFTNGVLINDDETRDVLLNTDYVHISLDAGSPETFRLLKQPKSKENKFEGILENISDIATLKAQRRGKINIVVGFVITPYNVHEIYSIAMRLKNIGVEVLRFKLDISLTFPLSYSQISLAKQQIERIKKELEDDKFEVIAIHDLEDKERGKRDFSECFAHFFWGTIGSDANVYPCDHNTFPGAPGYGNAIKRPFGEIWEGRLRRVLVEGNIFPEVCPPVCSPFGACVNPFMAFLKVLEKNEGIGKIERYLALP
ncbi:hypothetical protein A2230_03325 [candidate division WOR-1 bacterium RIFOXYA2_FULL_36_21]|uniref:Radical SAM core domain-containing protein n=1 Tax=candidate division WOR-1 bacterium RIFOXYB2_FULL_36_35 TaxID=1802578 RepID=A0A1F4RXU9_UNCSA|nr:MAG: hypothetical protein A2230_03325 [candidate division WOR-1 bacterium RIFOXYA2_FULL_36_21]OGC12977.1 MAG: hypothetical protein A2290_04925 [candidate division WOR-1 bacterium RIFOXYB2_FULL_36_35]OGC19975.1 MAG: hypothetical protein A2282_08295 [candidate division WOR-1 bacterium RIFOXYA12_FULL_36_13]